MLTSLVTVLSLEKLFATARIARTPFNHGDMDLLCPTLLITLTVVLDVRLAGVVCAL